jgi:hypothetical protein
VEQALGLAVRECGEGGGSGDVPTRVGILLCQGFKLNWGGGGERPAPLVLPPAALTSGTISVQGPG